MPVASTASTPLPRGTAFSVDRCSRRALENPLRSAKLHEHDPQVHLHDVLTRLPRQLNSHIDELIPRDWIAAR